MLNSLREPHHPCAIDAPPLNLHLADFRRELGEPHQMISPVETNGLGEQWLEDLRRQMLRIAERRVAADAAEDLVQDAMSIIVAKAPGLSPGAMVGGEPALAWCFQILRNVIGNHYQYSGRRRHENLEGVDLPDQLPDPLASLTEAEQNRRIKVALLRVGRDHPTCRRYLERLLQGDQPLRLAEEEGIAPAVMHRRLYRCRAWMRTILTAMGVEP